MKYAVTAQSFDRDTSKPSGRQRTEVINTDTNPIFGKCRNFVDVKSAYEAFWNELNTRSSHVVFVSQVIPQNF